MLDKSYPVAGMLQNIIFMAGYFVSPIIFVSCRYFPAGLIDFLLN